MDSLVNRWCWENWTATCKRVKLDPSLMLHTKIQSKWTKDLNVRPETIKFLEKAQALSSLPSVLAMTLNLAPKAKAPKAKIDK